MCPKSISASSSSLRDKPPFYTAFPNNKNFEEQRGCTRWCQACHDRHAACRSSTSSPCCLAAMFELSELSELSELFALLGQMGREYHDLDTLYTPFALIY